MSDCPSNPNPPDVEAAFPDDNAPENRVPKVSALCSYGMRPHVMTGFLRQLLIGHFSDPDNISEARVREQIKVIGGWAPIDLPQGHTGLLIESINRWAPNTADKRPAILIKRNDWKWTKQGIGDLVNTNLYTGNTSYSGLWEGSHTIFCLTQNGAETEFLTTEVVKFLILFSPMIREQMDLHRFFVAGVGGVGEVEEVIEGYAAPITVAYVAEERWSVQPSAPRLKRIVFKASDLLSG